MPQQQRVQVELGPVQETLLIPLLGRAEQTQRRNGIISDPKSVEIVDALDYDFDKWRGTPTLAGASVRARMFDSEVESFLRKHPHGTVVEIGAGLNTRYERLDNGSAHWLELDLPDSMALRQRFFEDTERRTMLAASALDTDWHDRVEKMRGPYCFVSEAVLIYLNGPDVEGMLSRLAARFPGSTFITDTTSSKLVDNQHKHDAMKHLPKDAWFRWRCDDPQTLEACGVTLESSLSFAEAPRKVVDAMPMVYRLMIRFLPALARRVAAGYHINRFVFRTPGEELAEASL